MATNTISAPGVSVPVTIASHSWNCTRISVAKKAPEPDQRRPRAMRSLGVDRSADDRQERLLEGHRTHRRRQAVSKGHVHDLVDSLWLCDHIQGVPCFVQLAEGLERIPLGAPVLDGVAEAPTHPIFHLPHCS